MTILSCRSFLLSLCTLILLFSVACTAELRPVSVEYPSEPEYEEEYHEEYEYDYYADEVFYIQVNHVMVVHDYHHGCNHRLYHHRHHRYHPVSHPEIRHKYQRKHAQPRHYDKHQNLKRHASHAHDCQCSVCRKPSVKKPCQCNYQNSHQGYNCSCSNHHHAKFKKPQHQPNHNPGQHDEPPQNHLQQQGKPHHSLGVQKSSEASQYQSQDETNNEPDSKSNHKPSPKYFSEHDSGNTKKSKAIEEKKRAPESQNKPKQKKVLKKKPN